MQAKFWVLILVVLVTLSCARRGRPEGGPIDEDKPIMVKGEPDYGTINFDEDEIKIYFDEFIKLKDISRQLVISPPLKYPPIIVPQGTASKFISIKILDTLKENTTYTFNFGQSISDNSEGNVLANFKFVVSTGDYIDSLFVRGKVKDAIEFKRPEDVVFMLYPYTENFSDSIVFKERPTYVGAMTDSINFEISNIKQGRYSLIAMIDKNKNYIYNQQDDKIGFHPSPIDVPGDSVYPMVLFTEDRPFKIPTKPSEISRGLVFIGFNGNAESMEVDVLDPVSNDFKAHYALDEKTDTLKYWFNNYDLDSIRFLISNKNFKDTITLRLREKDLDSLKFVSATRGVLDLRDTFKISTNNPIIQLDTSKIKLFKKDSVDVDFKIEMDSKKTNLFAFFNKDFDEEYKFIFEQGAIKDIFELENDSLVQKFSTKRPASYSSIFLTIRNVKSYPILVSLIDESGKIRATEYKTQQEEIRFENILPSRYKVRLIFDKNRNQKWDSGDYLNKIQPEEVYYFKTVLTANPNWEIVETFTIEN